MQHIKVFDPTTVMGPLFLDQMSYMEMKERQSVVVRKRYNIYYKDINKIK